MARFYGTKILRGDITIKDVPKRWRVETQNWLDKMDISTVKRLKLEVSSSA